MAGKALGASEPLLEGIYYAIQDTPPEERGWRPALGLPEDIDRQTDWSEILPLVRSETRAAEEQAGLVPSTRWESVSNASARPYVAAQHLRRMQKAFPDDEKAQLAAYFDSPELVRELQKQHGTLWYTELPLATQSFVARARRYAARRAP